MCVCEGVVKLWGTDHHLELYLHDELHRRTTRPLARKLALMPLAPAMFGLTFQLVLSVDRREVTRLAERQVVLPCP